MENSCPKCGTTIIKKRLPERTDWVPFPYCPKCVKFYTENEMEAYRERLESILKHFDNNKNFKVHEGLWIQYIDMKFELYNWHYHKGDDIVKAGWFTTNTEISIDTAEMMIKDSLKAQRKKEEIDKKRAEAKRKKEIVIATANPNKIKEFENILKPLGYKVLTLIDFPEVPEVVEDQDSFVGNAYKKAKVLGDYLKRDVISDDSGLMVKALDGDPGVHSARYGAKNGDRGTDEENIRELLKNLKDVKEEDRDAAYYTAICLYTYKENSTPEDNPGLIFDASLEGYIVDEPKGDNGFCYDPYFLVANDTRCLAEYSLEEKNEVSHRAQALRKLMEYLTLSGVRHDS